MPRPHHTALLALALSGCIDEPHPDLSTAPPGDVELDALCASRVAASGEAAAIAAQDRVDGIASRLAERESELTRLEQEMRNDDKRARAAATERDRLHAEVTALRTDLHTAERARDTARSELVATLKHLDAQIAEASAARADADRQRSRAQQSAWSTFVERAKNQICDRGSRKRHARCHDAVLQVLQGDLQSRFEACTHTEQAVPDLRRIEEDQDVPEFGERLPDDRAFTTKGWAVVFCDPALPEDE